MSIDLATWQQLAVGSCVLHPCPPPLACLTRPPAAPPAHCPHPHYFSDSRGHLHVLDTELGIKVWNEGRSPSPRTRLPGCAWVTRKGCRPEAAPQSPWGRGRAREGVHTTGRGSGCLPGRCRAVTGPTILLKYRMYSGQIPRSHCPRVLLCGSQPCTQ